MLLFLLSIALVIGSSTPNGQPVNLLCSARDNSARILRSEAPNDLHPDWAGDNVVGTGWSFVAKQRSTDMFGLEFLHGDLVSPRGGTINRNVLILAREWICRNP